MTQRKIDIVAKQITDPVSFFMDEVFAKPPKKIRSPTNLMFIILMILGI